MQPSLPPEAAQEGDLHLLWEALARKRRMSREPTLDSISELPEEDGRLQRQRQEAEEVAPDLSEDYSTADELTRTGEADLSHTSSDDESRAGTPSLVTYLKKAGRAGPSPLASKVRLQLCLKGEAWVSQIFTTHPLSICALSIHHLCVGPSAIHLSICLFIHCPSFHLSTYLCVCHPSSSIHQPFVHHPSTTQPFIHPPSIHLFIYPPIHPSILLPVCLSTRPSMLLSIRPSTIHPPTHPSIQPSTCLFIYPSICVSVHSSTHHTSIHLSTHPSIYSSTIPAHIHPFVGLPVSLSISSSTHLPTYLFIYPSIYPTAYPSIDHFCTCLSVHTLIRQSVYPPVLSTVHLFVLHLSHYLPIHLSIMYP